MNDYLNINRTLLDRNEDPVYNTMLPGLLVTPKGNGRDNTVYDNRLMIPDGAELDDATRHEIEGQRGAHAVRSATNKAAPYVASLLMGAQSFPYMLSLPGALSTLGGIAVGTIGNKAGRLVDKGLNNKTNWGEGIGSIVGGLIGGRLPYKPSVQTYINSRYQGNSRLNSAIDALAKTNVGKRAAEVAMRSRFETNPTFTPKEDIIQGWAYAPLKRKLSVLDYILTNGKLSKLHTYNKPFGYSLSLAPFKDGRTYYSDTELIFDTDKFLNDLQKVSMLQRAKMLFKQYPYNRSDTKYNWGKYNGENEVAYTGGFWGKHIPRNKIYGDAIDAYLYQKQIDPKYGLNLKNIGKDFGVHDDYINNKYRSLKDKISVYETDPMPDVEIVLGKHVINPKTNSRQGNIVTPSAEFDAGGHVLEKGEALIDDNGNIVTEPIYEIYKDGRLYSKARKFTITNPEGINIIRKDVPKIPYRDQDIWKFESGEYNDKWRPKSNIELIGLRLVDKAGIPFIVRSPWRIGLNQR